MGDFYDTLGVSRNADVKEIKSAYRKVAMKYHPDKNPGDSAAEDKFKVAAEAYSVLSDNQKRARYDQFGHQAYNQGGSGGPHMDMNDIFDHFGDIFTSAGFGSFFGGRGRGGSPGKVRGSDLKITIALSLEDQGIVPFDSVGQNFDADLHEALMSEESDKGENVILREFEKGYMYDDKILRHAKVVVSKS